MGARRRTSQYVCARAFALGVVILVVWIVGTGPSGGRPQFSGAHATDEASAWLATHASDYGYWVFAADAVGQVAGFVVVGGLAWIAFAVARSTWWAAVALAGGVQFLVLAACGYVVGQYAPLFSTAAGGVLADGASYLYGQSEMFLLLVYAQAGLGASVLATAWSLWHAKVLGWGLGGTGVAVGATGLVPFVLGSNLHIMQGAFELTNLARFVWLLTLAVLAWRGLFDNAEAPTVEVHNS